MTLHPWQVWLCGGSIEVIPCSKIAHIERSMKPYLPDLSITMKRNALRVAEVWLDEYKHNVNIAWNLPTEVKYAVRDRYWKSEVSLIDGGKIYALPLSRTME